MKIIIVDDYKAMSKKAAIIIANQIILKPNSVLGLATGSTPLGTYNELVELHKEGIIDFSQVTTFNLDEYYDLSPDNTNSYHYYMMNNLFQYINIDLENTNIPNGITEDIDKECESYDQKIIQAGGLDLQLLGIGANGHIGFNEPNIKFESKTHLVGLDEKTINDNSRFFENKELVPKKAITMGIKNIMQARSILLLASGIDKADAIEKTVHGSITPKVPASVLQLHPNATLIIDKLAASKLKTLS
ncbi:glucosamine-6-phosphate deaminase [Caldisalinibacter kiritimatiensis]|uniref:Glucosamine-6-phosphate deaminase n=1 Tax=Caldisalinibacter kiritimatiensis TaxID=1304284 RepID=R1CTY0_9FIRM|nr:glucosamine-6-phosphate deaminase [Caldisalinibacter kiritimatiensis]EOD00144.1 Glucosamine-6-phosphate deaminase [Caldisalinibacter kiritimatiensis]